ncbi:MAG TPA: S8 family serine peptidase [Anaerolineaceae bacterium]|nr:S8 family serine peptidase [Anaerolineaceae bacterium]
MKKKLFSLFIVFVFVLTSFSSFTTSSGIAKASDPDPTVTVEQAVLDEMQANGSASYWIQFKNTVDLSPAYTMSWSDRGWFVYKTLLNQAEVTQAQVQKYLLGSKVDYKSYWINNSILVTSSSKSVLNDLLKFDGVESIQARKSYKLYEPDTSAALLDNGINAVEPNLMHVNADDVWALGIDGAGLVVANIDTGVRYSHQALVGQYRGNLGGTFDHNYNWFNPDDLGDNVPRDGHGHGTHTMGTMVGDDGGANQIGIAPGAEWMACAGCPDGGCTDSALLGCGQFIAAPTDLAGANANPELRPNAVNNSWGDCGTTYDPWFAGVISAWHAVGTYPIFSNGNASNCGYPAPPGLNTVGNPARSGNVTGVGSSGEQNGQYASHSNWGPTDDLDTINPVDPFAMLKPQVLAPGVSIRSSVPGSDTSYEDGWTGTSMSAPHVTGLVALIWQAAPCLIGDYAATETLIESTAVDMVYDDGSTLTPTNFPNFATGWGEIDALAAVNYASGMCAMGTLEGMVTTDGTTPVEDAKIFADNGAGYTKNIYTAADGTYSSGLPDGTYTLTASKYGYQSDTVTGIVITEGATTIQDFEIPQLGMSLVSGYVYDGGVEGLGAHGYPLYSSIHVSTPGFDETIFTDPFTGYYEIELVEATEHTFTTNPIPGGYDPLVEAVTATGTEYTHDILVPVDGAVCAAPGYQPDYDIFYSFEGSDEGFTPGGTTSFAWGDFTSGPGEGHSGTKGIATNPGGVYNASELGWMASPVIDLSGNGTNSTAIQWWDWKDIESATYDWARLDVTKDGGVTWTTIWGPVGGVTDTEYHQQTVVLDPTYNVANFQFRFYFKSDSSVQYDGWYVDDVGIVSLPVPPATTVFSSNFDADNGGFVASGTNSTWAWGVPTSGPGAAYSAPNAWATNLAGYYNNSEESYITSPVIDLSAHAGLAPTISFMHWYNSESNTWDWGSVEASMDGGATWNVIWQKFGTSVDPWTPKSLQLDPAYAVSNFRFRFHFHSDSSVNSYYGWYIDDVAVTVAEPVEVAAPCVVIPGGVVAGYVYDDNDDSPIVGADVYSDVVETQTFFIPEDPASEGLFWVFHPVMGPVKGVQSLYGSNVVFDPTAGGASGYEPGVPTTLCFESNIYTGDWEYLYDTWLKFPMDWTISSAYLVGTPTCDSGSWGSFSVYWETEPYEIDIYHSASTEEVDHCVAEYCVDVTPSASAGLVSWYFDGDGYGSGPHHPCSSDSYTPGSMASQPCDQWENPQASIPAIGGEAHDFIAEKALYGSDTQTVTVFEDFIVQQDFYLGTGELEFDPESLEVTMFMGDAPVTETLTISNGGTSDAMFELVEKDEGFVLPKMMIPAFKGELPEDTRPVSMGLAPDAGKASTLSASKDNPFKGILAGESAFAVDAYPGENLVYFPDTTLPGTWTIVGGVPGSEFFAGDFVGGDFSQLYVVNSTGNTMYSVNTATTAQTMIGVTTPPSGQSFSGLTGTPDGTMYGLTTSCGGTNLVMVDVATAATTDLGALPGIDCGIDLAYNTDDDMIYIVDLITDSLFRVDPTTVTVTLVGSLGAAPNYAQGMDYEEESGVLYWAAYTTAGELRIIDTTTGASTLVGAFPGGAEVDSLAFATGGQSDVPWLSEDPISGTVPAEGSIDIDVIYDPTGAGLTQPGNYLAELKVKHDTPYTYPNIPVVLHLIAPEDYGTFNGHVLGMEACDVNPAALEGATVNFWQDGMIKYTTTTNAEGYYSYAVPEGMYDIEVMMDGYMSDIEFGRDVLGGDTVTVDFTLRLEAPCISVDPTSLEQTQPTDTVTTQTLTIINTGAGDGVFELFEMEATGLHADVELIVDDGTRENGIGIGGTLEFLWLNRFTPDPDSFPFNLDQVQIYFTAEDMVNIGDEIRIVVYENVTANADPAVGSNFLYSYDTTVQALGTWNLFDLPEPVELNGPGDVLVGLIGLEVPGTSYWPAAIDETATQGRSWAGWWNASPPPIPPTLPPDADWTLIDAYFPGNWMVRGMGSSAAGDILWLSLDPTAGVVFADSETDVTVTYDSTGLAEGDYFASIRVKNPPAAAINVPVTLHVTNLRMLYLPLILK